MTTKRATTWAPCRIDYAGGTIDLWPLYLYQGGLELVQMGISIGVTSSVEWTPESSGHHITIESIDFEKKKKFSSLKQLEESLDQGTGQNPLRWIVRLTHHFLKKHKSFGNWHIQCNSLVPSGSGLGGSSVLGISLAKSLEKVLLSSSKRSDPWDLQKTVRDVEAIEIAHPAGDQDFVPALFGGLLIFHMGPNFRSIEKLPMKTSRELAARSALLYTGKPHHSGMNNWQVMRSYHEGNERVRQSLASIGKTSSEMAAALRKNDIDLTMELLNKEWSYRKQLSPAVSAPVLDQAWKFGKKLGAKARKACGSGGGGCLLMMFESAEKRQEAISAKTPLDDWKWLDFSESPFLL